MKKELHEQGRFFVYSIMIFLLLLILLTYLTSESWHYHHSLRKNALAFFSILYLLLCALLGSSLIAGEKEQGTFNFLAHLSVSREHILLSKWLASLILLAGFLTLGLLGIFFLGTLDISLLSSQGAERNGFPPPLSQLPLLGLWLYFVGSLLSFLLNRTLTALLALFLLWILFTTVGQTIAFYYPWPGFYLELLLPLIGIAGSLILVKRIPAT